MHQRGIEERPGGGAALRDEGKFSGEFRHRSIHAVASRAAQFDEVAGRRNRHQQPSFIAQHSPEFRGIQARGDRQHQGKGTTGIGNEAVRIGYDPFACRVAPRRGINGRGRDVEAVSRNSYPAGKSPEVESVTTPNVKDSLAGMRVRHLRNGFQQWQSDAAIVQAPPPRRRGYGIAWLLRAPLLGLQ